MIDHDCASIRRRRHRLHQTSCQQATICCCKARRGGVSPQLTCSHVHKFSRSHIHTLCQSCHVHTLTRSHVFFSHGTLIRDFVNTIQIVTITDEILAIYYRRYHPKNSPSRNMPLCKMTSLWEKMPRPFGTPSSNSPS